MVYDVMSGKWASDGVGASFACFIRGGWGWGNHIIWLCSSWLGQYSKQFLKASLLKISGLA